jgi:hypothetical protein
VLSDLARSGKVRVFGYNYKDEPADAQRWLAQLGDPYYVNIVDADGQAALDWGIYGAPETFLVDARGIVRWKYVGPITPEVGRAGHPADAGVGAVRALLLLAGVGVLAAAPALAQVADPTPIAFRDAAEEARFRAPVRRAALREVPEPVARRLGRADRARPAPAGAAPDARRAQRRRDQGLPGRALQRVRAVRAAGAARPRGCCGSARCCCSPPAAWWSRWSFARARALPPVPPAWQAPVPMKPTDPGSDQEW